MATISTHNGAKLSFEHNIRDPRYTEPQKHIDPTLTKYNQTFVNAEKRSHVEIINEIFADDVAKYNEGKRKDRRIKNYYKKIAEQYEREAQRIKDNPYVEDKKTGELHKRKNKKPQPQTEMIIGVYEKNGEEISRDTKIKIQEDYVKMWQQIFPAVKIVGAYCHVDEPDSNIHTHIDYTTISTGFKQGMEHQISGYKCYNKSIHQVIGKKFEFEIGDKNYTIDFTDWKAPSYGSRKTKNDRPMTPLKYWTSMANWMLEQVCNAHGIEVEHPQRGQQVKHKDTPEFKLQTEIEKQEAVLAEKKVKLKRLTEASRYKMTDSQKQEIQRLKSKLKSYQLTSEQQESLERMRSNIRNLSTSTTPEIESWQKQEIESLKNKKQNWMKTLEESEKTLKELTEEHQHLADELKTLKRA